MAGSHHSGPGGQEPHQTEEDGTQDCARPSRDLSRREFQSLGGQYQTLLIICSHLEYFQDDKHIKEFEGFNKFEEEKNNELKKASNAKNKSKVLKAYNPTPSLKEKFTESIRAAELVQKLSPELRVGEMIRINNEIEMSSSNNSKKKRKLEHETDDENNKVSNKKPKLESDVEEERKELVEIPKGATRRQMDVKLQKEEKERKEKEKGPAWTYELVYDAKTTASASPAPVFGQFVSGRCCVVCQEPGGQVWRCRGQCNSHYHPQCQGVDTDHVTVEQFRCKQCQTGEHKCAVCGHHQGDSPVSRCHVSGCGKFYHDSCLTRYTIWPQHKITNGNIYCPDHTCHTCASDNPRDPVMKYNEKLVHCIKCPTAYHSGDQCLAAGTIQLTKTDIICPKHYKPPVKTKKGSGASHVNTNWCFICSKGGNLLCCDNCPAAIHEECLGNKEPIGDKYYCEDCQSGNDAVCPKNTQKI